MDLVRRGREIRALRHRRRWRQADLAGAAGLSPSAVSRIELGQSPAARLGVVERMAAALDARLDVRVRWQGEGLDRLLDAAHAALVEDVVRILSASGWDVSTEATFAVYGERGSVDVLGRHVQRRLLLIVEVKATIGDVQATQSSFDRKVRHAHAIAGERGWASWPVAQVLVVGEGATSRRRVADHAATFRSRWPAGSRQVRRWIDSDSREPIAGLWFLSPTRRLGVRRRVRRSVRLPPPAHPRRG